MVGLLVIAHLRRRGPKTFSGTIQTRKYIEDVSFSPTGFAGYRGRVFSSSHPTTQTAVGSCPRFSLIAEQAKKPLQFLSWPQAARLGALA